MLVFIFSAWQAPALSFLPETVSRLALSKASFDHDPDGISEDGGGLFSGQMPGCCRACNAQSRPVMESELVSVREAQLLCLQIPLVAV